jgi:hypothetical protein
MKVLFSFLPILVLSFASACAGFVVNCHYDKILPEGVENCDAELDEAFDVALPTYYSELESQNLRGRRSLVGCTEVCMYCPRPVQLSWICKCGRRNLETNETKSEFPEPRDDFRRHLTGKDHKKDTYTPGDKTIGAFKSFAAKMDKSNECRLIMLQMKCDIFD